MQKEKTGYTAGNIIIEQSVVDLLSDFQKRHSFTKESGGIIIGYYDSLIKKIRITDITFPQIRDQQGRFRFVRFSEGHQKMMDELWKASGYKKSYLGEWHSHNQKDPIPSWVDINNWKKITKRNNNYETSIFIIVGTENIGVWCSNIQIEKVSSFRLEELQ